MINYVIIIEIEFSKLNQFGFHDNNYIMIKMITFLRLYVKTYDYFVNLQTYKPVVEKNTK